MREIDVLIVGLGPVGATAANIAGALGLDCVGVDYSPEVFRLPRAIHFDAEIMRIFQSVDVADKIEDIVRVGRGSVHLGADGEPIRDFRVAGEIGDLGWSPHYMFYQPQLDQLLRDCAAARSSVELQLGRRCEQIEQDPDGVLATISDSSGASEVIRTRYLIACDGASSGVRRQLGIEFSDFGFEEPWAVVDMRVSSADLGPDHIVTRCDPARPIVYVPGPGRHRRWEYMILPGEDPRALIEPEAIRAVIGPASPWLDVDGSEMIRSAIYTFHGLVATRWEDGRVFLAGDAAHQTPPFYAQGMCHGIRDVNGLLWKLTMVLRGRAEPNLLDTYQVEREPHVRQIIEASVENGRYICMLDPDEAARRDASFRALMRDKRDIASFRGVIPGLSAGFLQPPGPLGETVGQPFPQNMVRDASGQLRRSDDVLGPNFSVVGAGDPTAIDEDWFVTEMEGRVVGVRPNGGQSVPRDDVFEDVSGALVNWFRTQGAEWALIRPDRYVFGLAADPHELRALIATLRQMLGSDKAPIRLTPLRAE